MDPVTKNLRTALEALTKGEEHYGDPFWGIDHAGLPTLLLATERLVVLYEYGEDGRPHRAGALKLPLSCVIPSPVFGPGSGIYRLQDDSPTGELRFMLDPENQNVRKFDAWGRRTHGDARWVGWIGVLDVT